MRRVHALAFVLCTAASLATGDAFSVTTEPVLPFADSTDPHRVLAQRYIIAQPFVDRLVQHATLQTLKIAMPGRVFVSYNDDLLSSSSPPPSSSTENEWSTPVATIRFSGNSEAIFKSFEVVCTAPNMIEVRRRPSEHGSQDGYLLTEIAVSQSNALSQIVVSGSGDVIVEDDVVVSDGVLTIQHSGSGNMYLDAASSSLTTVHLSSSGSGDVVCTTVAMQTESLKLELAGSGSLTLMGQHLVATAVDVAITGSGDICVDAAEIQSTTLSTATTGSGSISFASRSGHCTYEDISLMGSGDVFLGTMKCEDVKVKVAGSGDVYVQAMHSITGSAWGSGDVSFVGNTPPQISDRHDASVFSHEQSKKYRPIAKHKNTNKHTTCTATPVPVRSTVRVSGAFWDGSLNNPSAILGPLVFFALLALCYLRSQVKRSRRSQRERGPRFGGTSSYRANPQELQPLQPAYQQVPYQQPPPQQGQSTQVYV